MPCPIRPYKTIPAIDARLIYGVPALLLLAPAIALLAVWGRLLVAAALVLSASVACAKARRCGALDLPEVRLSEF